MFFHAMKDTRRCNVHTTLFCFGRDSESVPFKQVESECGFPFKGGLAEHIVGYSGKSCLVRSLIRHDLIASWEKTDKTKKRLDFGEMDLQYARGILILLTGGRWHDPVAYIRRYCRPGVPALTRTSRRLVESRRGQEVCIPSVEIFGRQTKDFVE
ncbi:hypothetical protein PDE_05729 [Penicillium oxalicum 114-2]|uniref:Uncharacterized protein n=1 Tax=Penicillium oxalicum (strain 114-2 / CGMCC 5302) TaxID=933388 RepID=S8B7S5_PENO1|nr:hypothetical protein PDE_05729 [Penicillium oxalicum 114-2]